MKDAEFVSELFIAIVEGVQEGTQTLDKYYELYDDQFQEKDKWEKHFSKTQTAIEEILGELRGTQWNNKADFYALFVAVSGILGHHSYSPDDYVDLKDCLFEFRRLVNIEKDQSKNKVRSEYYTTVGFGRLSDKELRAKRVDIIKKLMLPYVASKDPNRNFTDEQRQLAWDMSKDKKCALCDKKVEWIDYNLDHKVSHIKGGRTMLSNSQITHKKCNASKSNRT
jgi:5-methylcytosine-specific restriction endonuclease McrA